jgi:exopolyphosphatase / guanosine-5'-triphosphate,3'-diphosphate pyrophosphatase
MALSETTLNGDAKARLAVIDIGSNTVRLVVYDAPGHLPIPVFNEKALCRLGHGMEKTGRLYEKGVDQAMVTLTRFVSLAAAMGVEKLDLVATAAVRDATDGADFVKRVEDAFDLKVSVLSGTEEAHLAAFGLLSGIPRADGILGDLGGGSLDLVALDHGAFGHSATLPLGHLRLADASNGKPEKALKPIAKHLGDLPWLKEMRGRTLYGVGGSWRALARLFIEQTHYPLHVIDGYMLEREEALDLSRLIGGLSHDSIDKIPGVPGRRTETLPYAAKVLEALLETVCPEKLVFSGFGMREGRMLQNLPQEWRDEDPLIGGCAFLAGAPQEFLISGQEIMDWIAPLFPGDSPQERRLRLAACLLSGIGRSEHPDYRAEHAFHRVLRLPFAGLTHAERVYLALAVFVRYNGDPAAQLVSPVRSLLDENRQEHAHVTGLALRLAHTLSGGAPGLLGRTSLEADEETLTLRLPDEEDIFVSEAATRRFKSLARSMGRSGLVV